jgi:cysteine desulfurase/selenocysteine lyase
MTAPHLQALISESLRADFPILEQKMHDKPLVYLDSAASAQKPQVVIDAISGFYETGYANIHRGVYKLSQDATEAYEHARNSVRDFIGAAEAREIIFTRGTTEAINLVAQTYGRSALGPGDEILITEMEHHSNIVPWQILCEQTGAKLVVGLMDDTGALLLENFAELINARTKLVAVSHVSNALGTINPVREIIELAHAQNIPVLLDGAQAAPHMPIDVQALDVDFYTFSGHKVYGPTGIGVLYGKAALLEAMPPYQGGGDMILSVTFEKTEYNEIPHKFEAGTPNIAGVIGLGVALEYLQGIGMDRIAAHEAALLSYATEKLEGIPQVTIIGTAKEKAGVISFAVEGIHPHDLGTIFDMDGVAIRAGHHCAQPVMEHFGVPATARASFGLYNNFEDVDMLVKTIQHAMEVFS